jgi:[acyl-carrier-protein] S-malonyltransferase
VNAVLLCPGQGAQKVGMGKDLAERFPAARDVFAQADEALGVGLSRVMWEGPEGELTLTHNAQPAILVHSLAVYAVVGDRTTPVAAAGHSLGEYAAYAAVGPSRCRTRCGSSGGGVS